jgi:hypothetical protein
VSFGRPEVDIHAPPARLDDLIEWFDRVSYRLVLLEEYTVPDVDAAIRCLEGAVRAHLDAEEVRPSGRPTPPADPRLGRLIAADHVRFPDSLEQLRWFYRRVTEAPIGEAGGHRQALGQYGRVLAEALRRHRQDERRYLGMLRIGDAAEARPLRRKP